MFQPLVSICIPCYKKTDYVVRCVQSIAKQDYKNVEVIISDDSPNEDIKAALQPYADKLIIHYYHNKIPLKSPQNWNAALGKGNGDLMVLMHQDDWYHTINALSKYVGIFGDPGVDFVFCRNTAVDEEGNTFILQAIPDLPHRLHKNPNHLLLAQVIGPPSNTMLHKRVNVRYDERLIWLVDVDYYVRVLKGGFKYHYIPEHLVTIGLHQDQTTVFVRNNDHIILKENMLFAAKIENGAFDDIKIFDYYWRLLRNHKVRSIDNIISAGVEDGEIPTVLRKMLLFQKQLPYKTLKFGAFSKTAMSIAYLYHMLSKKNN